MKISILTPTRGRPTRLIDFYESIIKNTKNSEVELLSYVDTDDPNINEYKKRLINLKSKLKNKNFSIQEIYSSRKWVSKSWNDLAKKSTGNILIMGNDDQIYKTFGWDEILINKVITIEDDLYCIWFNDLFNFEKHCAFPVISRKWYNILGYFTPGIFPAGYNDTWIFDIAKKVNRAFYIDEIVADHIHFHNNRAEYDSTYRELRESKDGNMFELGREIYEKTKFKRNLEATKIWIYIKYYRFLKFFK